MSRKRLPRFIAAFSLLILISPAYAMPHPVPPARPTCPFVSRFHRRPVRAVPMLLPIAEMRSYALHLSGHQVSTLAVWRNHHLRQAIPLLKRLRGEKAALHTALLRGDGAATVTALVARIDKSRARLLALKVAQARFVRRTLTPPQWHHLLRITHRMREMGFRWGR